MSNAPSWGTTPPAEVWHAVVNSAEYAARRDETGSVVALAECGHDARLLAIAGIRLLAGVIAEGVPADEMRHGVVELAARNGATDLTVTNALETVAMAEFLAIDDMKALGELCTGSQLSAFDHAVMACALAGQAIAAVADDPAGVFDRLRAQDGGAA